MAQGGGHGFRGHSLGYVPARIGHRPAREKEALEHRDWGVVYGITQSRRSLKRPNKKCIGTHIPTKTNRRRMKKKIETLRATEVETTRRPGAVEPPLGLANWGSTLSRHVQCPVSTAVQLSRLQPVASIARQLHSRLAGNRRLPLHRSVSGGRLHQQLRQPGRRGGSSALSAAAMSVGAAAPSPRGPVAARGRAGSGGGSPYRPAGADLSQPAVQRPTRADGQHPVTP